MSSLLRQQNTGSENKTDGAFQRTVNKCEKEYNQSTVKKTLSKHISQRRKSHSKALKEEKRGWTEAHCNFEKSMN